MDWQCVGGVKVEDGETPKDEEEDECDSELPVADSRSGRMDLGRPLLTVGTVYDASAVEARPGWQYSGCSLLSLSHWYHLCKQQLYHLSSASFSSASDCRRKAFVCLLLSGSHQAV